MVISYETAMHLLFMLPRFRALNLAKSAFLRVLGAQVGRRVVFYPGLWIAPPRGLVIGDDVDLALGVLISASGGVYIGDRTLVGYRSQILSSNHRVGSVGEPIFSSGHVKAAVRIEDDCWIGANCIILPGVTIGRGAVVAGGSIVTRDVPSGSIVAGVPAKVIKYRSSE